MQRMAALVKSVFYIIGMAILAPIAINKIVKAGGSDVKYGFDFYHIAKGG